MNTSPYLTSIETYLDVYQGDPTWDCGNGRVLR